MKKIIIITLALLIILSSMALSQRRLDYNGYIRSAKIYLGETPKDYKKAAELCEDAIEYYPDRPPLEAHYILGTIYSDKRLYQEMRNEFDYVLAVCDTTSDEDVIKTCNKENFAPKIEAILSSNWLTFYNNGVQNLKRATAKDSACAMESDTELRTRCDSIAREFFRETVETFKTAVLILPDSAQGWVNLGLSLYKMGNVEEAMQAYSEAVKLNSSDLNLLRNIASIYFNEQMYDSAANYFNMILEQPIDESSRASVLYNLAVCMNTIGQNDSAITVFEKVVEINPDDADAHYNMGAMKVKQTNPLLDDRKKYVDSLDVDREKYQNLIKEIDTKVKAIYESAMHNFAKTAELQPDNMDALSWLGFSQMMLEDWEGMVPTYKQMLEIDPENAEAWCQLSIAHTRLGNKAEAQEANKKCNELENK